MARKHKKKTTVETKGGSDGRFIGSSSVDKTPAEISREPPDTELRPAKRLKPDHGVSAPLTDTMEGSILQDQRPSGSENAKKVPSRAFWLPSAVESLQDQYELSTLSVISSTKIAHKVRVLLQRIEKSDPANSNAKPRIVVLGAKGAVASKLISIVEIAKADVAKRGGKWYQYSTLRSELLPLKSKPKRPSPSGHSLADAEPKSATTGIDPPQPVEEVNNSQADTEAINSEDDGEAFETIKPRNDGSAAGDVTKVRATPIMTIYFTSMPIPMLKDLYG
ncbi:MAG: hypothetical protein Q9219_002586 [cf. Caloplaca sp. 3 TL-2023]